MIVRISRGRIKDGSWDQFEAAWSQVYGNHAPAGLRARALTRDTTDDNRGASISVWDDMAAMSAAAEVLSGAMNSMEAYFTGDYETYVGELRGHEGLFAT